MSEKKDFLEQIPSRELPLSTVENTPPLMLDLPDGQQLVVGKLPDGIVIEIATWRGTGRPDSRTNRMMLGVSYDEDDDQDQTPRRALLKRIKREPENLSAVSTQVIPETPANEEPVVVVVHGDEISKDSAPAERLPEIIDESAFIPVPPLHMETVEEDENDGSHHVVLDSSLSPDEITEVESINSDVAQEDVIEILAQEEVPVFGSAEPVLPPRNMQDLFGARPRAQLEEEPQSPLMNRSHEIVRRPSKKGRAMEFKIEKLIKPASAIALTALGVFLLVGPGGVRFTLPEGGLRTSMSSAENALVIVRESDDYAIGDSVVAAIQGPDKPHYFASIAAQSDTEFVLTENNLYHTTLREDVKGKVLLVMPGIGYLLHKVGL